MDSPSNAVPQLAERIVDQYTQLEKENRRLKADKRKSEEEKAEMNRVNVMYAEMVNAANLEKHQQLEIVKRIDQFAHSMISLIPQEHQQGMRDTLQHAKQVSAHEIGQMVGVPHGAMTIAQTHTNGTAGMCYAVGPGGMVPGMAQPVRYEASVNATRPMDSSADHNVNGEKARQKNKRKHHGMEREEEIDVSGVDQDRHSGSAPNTTTATAISALNGSSHSHNDRDSKMSSSERDASTKKQKRSNHDSTSTLSGPSSHKAPSATAQAPIMAPGQQGQAQPQQAVQGQRTTTPEAVIYSTGMPNGHQLLFQPRPGYVPVGMPAGMQPGMPAIPYPQPTALPPGQAEMAAAYPPGTFIQIPPQGMRYPGAQFDPRHIAAGIPPQPTASATAAPPASQPSPAAKATTYQYHDGQAIAITAPPEFFHQPGMPRSAAVARRLPNDDVVCAVTIDTRLRRILTGAKGCVKLWDLDNLQNVTDVRLLGDSFIRSCKILACGKTLVVGGEHANLGLYDLEANRSVGELSAASATACYAVALSDDGSIMYSSCSNGIVALFDVRTRKMITQIQGHSDGASCLDLSRDGQQLVTGGLDKKVKIWDTRNMSTEVKTYEYDSQVFSIGHSVQADGEYLAVGLGGSTIELINLRCNARSTLHLHEQAVLSLKFPPSGKWFAATGKDGLVSLWGMPLGLNLTHEKESRSVLCCDVSADEKYIVIGTGSHDAVLYNVGY